MQGAANGELLDIGPLLPFRLPPGVRGVTVDRHVFTRIQEGFDRMRLQGFSAQRDDAQQALWLRPVVGNEIFASKHHDADVCGEVAHFGRVEGQFVPTRYRRLEVVVEE